MKSYKDIITDEEVDRVHGHSNFGPLSESTPGKRQVLDEAILKAASSFHNGSRANAILADHGLIKDPKKNGRGNLTKRGKDYLFARYSAGERLNPRNKDIDVTYTYEMFESGGYRIYRTAKGNNVSMKCLVAKVVRNDFDIDNARLSAESLVEKLNSGEITL